MVAYLDLIPADESPWNLRGKYRVRLRVVEEGGTLWIPVDELALRILRMIDPYASCYYIGPRSVEAYSKYIYEQG